MKNRRFSIFLIVFGALFVIYDLISLCINPGIFIDIIRAFSNIWLVLGGYLIFVGIYEIKKGRLFWSIWKKWIKVAFCVCAVIGVGVSITNLIRMNNASWADENVSPDCVILLGGGITKHGTLPKSVQYRSEATARYLNEHEEVMCVVSGGKRKYQPYAEAPALKAYLVELGIDENRILVDDKALDTIQNLENSAKLIAEDNQCEIADVLKMNVVLASSRFHIARAERLARRMGFEKVYGIGSKIPPIAFLNSYGREICSYIKLDLRILLTGKPKSIL